MTCEKQFVPANNTFLYCSETCRLTDQTATAYSVSYSPSSPPLTPYSRTFSSLPISIPDDGPDIVPRFSPTQTRPRSYFNSEPYATSHQASYSYASSPPQSNAYANSTSSTALASLRELATALPKSSRDPESPLSSMSRTGSGVWNYIPFSSSSKTTNPTPSATPGNSFSGGHTVSQSYGAAEYSYGRSQSTYAGQTGMDRPLPPRSGPSGYGHRPSSIDLLTPISGPI